MSTWQEVDETRQAALEAFKEAAKKRDLALKEYEQKLLEAHRVGVPNSAMASAIRVTEAAIRIYIKRKKKGV